MVSFSYNVVQPPKLFMTHPGIITKTCLLLHRIKDCSEGCQENIARHGHYQLHRAGVVGAPQREIA